MFQKENRSGLIIYLYYNRDAKKLANYGDICYHSKKHRYLQLYVPTEEVAGKSFRKREIYQESESLSYPRIGNSFRWEPI